MLLTTDPVCDGVVGFVVVPLFDKDICLCSFTEVNNIEKKICKKQERFNLVIPSHLLNLQTLTNPILLFTRDVRY